MEEGFIKVIVFEGSEWRYFWQVFASTFVILHQTRSAFFS